MSGRFVLATFNANSIRVRLNQILGWLAQRHCDVLCVQETKVQDKDFPVEPIRAAGYHVVYAGQKSHAGIATLSKEAPTWVQVGFDDGSERTRLLCTEIEGIVIINTYVPQGRAPDHPEFQHKLTWLRRFREWLDAHFTPETPLAWVGDFNIAVEDIDVYDPVRLRGHVDFHPEAQAALEEVRAWGFVDVFRKHHPGEAGQYTYWDYRARNPVERGVGWRVDHIWATRPLAARSVCAWIDTEARKAERPSDHTFLVAEFEL